MILVTFLLVFASAASNVSSPISPLLVVLKNDGVLAFWLGAIGISVGLLAQGRNVLTTVGFKIIKIDEVKGFAIYFVTSICILVGAYLGIPLSTTHCILATQIGTVLGYNLF